MTPNEQFKTFAASAAFYARELQRLDHGIRSGKITRIKFLLRFAELASRLAQVKRDIDRFIGSPE